MKFQNSARVGVVAGSAIASLIGIGTASASPAQDQCDVHAHFVVNHAGNETISYFGDCGGSPVTAHEMGRLAEHLVIPRWSGTAEATPAQDRRWGLHGPCQIFAISGKLTLAVICRNGGHKFETQ